MTFGPDVILVCPHCRNIFIRHTIGSGNSVGARVWSDGKMLAPMMPILPIIHWCGHCRNYFFIEDAEEVGNAPMSSFISGHEVIDTWDNMEINDYMAAIETGVFNWRKYKLEQNGKKERERQLRMRLWWKINDTVRNGRHNIETNVKPVFQENLKRLGQLLEENAAPDALLTRAEALRELGQTEASISLLKSIKEEVENDVEMERVMGSVEEIQRKAALGETMVFELTIKDEEESNE